MNILYLNDSSTNLIREQLQPQFSSHTWIPIPVTCFGRNEYDFHGLTTLADPANKLLLWGSGDLHHVSFRFAPKTPYHKAMADAHDDLRNMVDGEYQPRPFERLDCGNHLSRSLVSDENLIGAELFGVEYPMMEGEHPAVSHAQNVSGLYGSKVHLSLDFDVLWGFPSSHAYARASRSVDELRTYVDSVLENNDVLKTDIGGFDIDGRIGNLSASEIYAEYMDKCIRTRRAADENQVQSLRLTRAD